MIDVAELKALAADLARANVGRAVRPVMSKAGLEMKKRARAEAPKGKHIPGYARSINYELKDGGTAVELKPNEVGQGLLSAVLEFGQGPNAAHPHIIPQLDREAAVAEDFLGDAVMRMVLGGR